MKRYPDMGAFPTPMGASFYRTAGLHKDGTTQDNPVAVIGTKEVDGVTYVSSKLTHSDSIQFESEPLVVHSTVPLPMTTAFAYANAASCYDPGGDGESRFLHTRAVERRCGHASHRIAASQFLRLA